MKHGHIRTCSPDGRFLRFPEFSKRYEITGRAAPEGADLPYAPCVIGWGSGSVQPAADAHFRLTSKKNEYPEAWLFHFPVLCEAGFRR